MDDNQNKKSTFIKRLVSGSILLITLCVVLFYGGNLLFYSTCILSIIGLVELHKVFKLSKVLLSISCIFTIFYYLVIYQYKTDGILLFLIALVLLLLIFYVISYPNIHIKDISLTLFSILYVSMMFSFVYLIREQRGEYGKYLVWLIFISSWGCDTCAYCTGMLFGKHKLSVTLSPKKTIEGSIGGIIGSIILGIIYTYLMINKLNEDLQVSLIRVSIACGVGSIISQIGDLTASAIKRDYNVKDYGDIIPGHGGILDRFDSVIFTAPIFFFILNIYR